MNISFENLNKVKRSFERLVEKNNILDADYPFFNTYMWLNKKDNGEQEEILFSSGYRTQFLAREMADQSNADPKIANAPENQIVWLGVLDGSRTMIPAKKY